MTGGIVIESTRIEHDEDFEVSLEFGLAASQLDFPASEQREYIVSLHAESLDANPDKILGTKRATLPTHDATISVDGGTLEPGSYKLASTWVVKGSRLAGYVEGPIIQVT